MLGITKEAGQKAITDAFRNLALKYHPDRNNEPGTEERFKEIAEAYAILSDPKKRSEYDARGFAGVAGFNREDLFGGINFEDVFGGLDFDFGIDNLFSGLFRHRHKGSPHGPNVDVDLYITLQRVAEGGEEKVHLSRPVACPTCNGTGGEGAFLARGRLVPWLPGSPGICLWWCVHYAIRDSKGQVRICCGLSPYHLPTRYSVLPWKCPH